MWQIIRYNYIEWIKEYEIKNCCKQRKGHNEMKNNHNSEHVRVNESAIHLLASS